MNSTEVWTCFFLNEWGFHTFTSSKISAICMNWVTPPSSFSPSLFPAISISLSSRIECLWFLPSPVKFQSPVTVKEAIVAPWWGMSLHCSSKTSFGQEFGGILRSVWGDCFLLQERRSLTDSQTLNKYKNNEAYQLTKQKMTYISKCPL